MDTIKTLEQIKTFSIKQIDLSLSFEDNIINNFGQEALDILINFFNQYHSNTSTLNIKPLFDSEIEAFIALSLHDLGKTYYLMIKDKKIQN
jgi:hypothetical protein